MPPKPMYSDPAAKELLSIKAILQDLLIIEAAKAGLDKSEVRKLLKVGDARVSAIWRHLKLSSPTTD